MGKILLSGHVLKPRSTDVSQKSSPIDHVQRHLDLFQRHVIQQDEWPRRWLWLEERDADVWLSYSEKPGGDILKKLRVSDIVAVHSLDSRNALKEGVPQVGLINECFVVLTNEKRLVFASLDGKKAEWLSTLRGLNISGVSDEDKSESEDDSTSEEDVTEDSYDDDCNESIDVDLEEDEEEEEFEEDEGDDSFDEDGTNTEPTSPSSPGSPYNAQLAAVPHIFLDAEVFSSVQRSIGRDKQVLFAAKVTKCSSKDKDQDRIVAIVDSTLYIIERGTLKMHKTRIPTQQITGVIRNIHDDMQLAVLWCSGHDYLITFQEGGVEVVDAFIAHLAKQHASTPEHGAFIVRESLNILTAIRRSETDSYEVLDSEKHDKIHAAREAEVFPTLRMNGDAKVVLSDIVIKESSSGESEKLLVVTDLAIYFFQRKDFSNLTRRIGLKEIRSLMCYEAEGYILVQTGFTERGKRSGDILFRPATYSRDSPDSTYRVFLDLVGSNDRRKIAIAQSRSKAKLFSEGKLDKRDAITKLHTGGARRMKKVKELKDLRKVGKKMANITQKVGGGLFHMSEDVVKGMTGGMVKMVEGSMGMVYDMVGLSAGLGLHPATVQAAESVRIGTDKLTGPRGNAVFMPLAASALADLERGFDSRDVDKGPMTQSLLRNVRFADEADLPEKEKVWYVCNVLDLLEPHQAHLVLVVTSRYVLLYSDSSKGEGKPNFSRKSRIYHMHIQHLHLVVDCVTAPEHFLLAFKEKDFLLSCRHRYLDLLKRYLLRRHSKVKRKHPEASLRIGMVESPQHLRILRRSCGDALPQQALLPLSDHLHLGACEVAVELLSRFNETSMHFSAIAESQLFVKQTEEGKRSFDTRKVFVAVTESALYLLRGTESLVIKRRIELPCIGGLIVNAAQNDEVLVQALHYRIAVKQTTNPRLPVVGEAVATAILEETFNLPGCVDIVSRTSGQVVFRVWPINIDCVKRVKTRFHKAASDSLPALFQGGTVTVADELHHDDLLLKFDSHAEDFTNQLSRARIQWTPFEQPRVHEDAVCGLPLHFMDCPTRNEKSTGHPLAGFAKFPARQEILNIPDPATLHAAHESWMSRRLKRALDSESAEALQYELHKGTALGLVSPSERRVMLRGTRGRMSSSEAYKQRVLTQLASYISDDKFAEFDRLAARTASVLTPDVKAYCNKAFRPTTEWYRKAEGAVTVAYCDGWDLDSRVVTLEEAQLWCLQHDNCVGFTHEGDQRAQGPVNVTFRTSRFDEVAYRRVRQAARLPIAPPSSGLLRSPSASQRMAAPKQQTTPALPPNTVYTGLHPCQDALVNVLDSTTWLKSTTQIALLRKRKNDAMQQREVLGHIEQLIPSMMGEAPQRLDIDMLELYINRARQQTRDHATNENSHNAADMLHTILLVLTACVQRENIKRGVDDATDPVAARMRQLSWYSLCRDEEYNDVEEDLDGIQYLAGSVWNAQVELELLHCRDPGQSTFASLEYFLNELYGDFEEAAAGLTYSDDLLETAVKHRWLAQVSEEEDEEVTQSLEESQHDVLQRIIWKKKIAESVELGDEEGLQEVADESDSAMEADIADARRELGRQRERAAVAARVQNLLSSASRAFSSVSQATEQELASVVLGLEEVLPQARAFTSLHSEAMCLAFLHTRLQAHQLSKLEEKEREEAEAKRRVEAELVDKQRSDSLQQRMDQKETAKLQRAVLAAEKIHTKAVKMQGLCEQASAQVKPDESTCTRRRNDCVAALSDARSFNQTNPHEKLRAAIAILETLVAKWDELMIGKEEQERKALAKQVTDVIDSKDRETYYNFVKSHVSVLPPDELMRLRLGWAAVQAKAEEQKESVGRMQEAIKYRDKFELEKTIDDAIASGLEEDNTTLVTARELLFELQGAGSPLCRDEAVENDPANDGGNGDGADSYVDSEEEDAASPCTFRITGFESRQMSSPVRTEGGLLSPTGIASPDSMASPARGAEGEPSVASPQEAPKAPPLPPPPADSEVLKGLYSALLGLKESSEVDAYGLVRCQLNNPWVKTYVDAWKVVIKFKLKKKGAFLRKEERNEMDVFNEVGLNDYNTSIAMKHFDLARRINHTTASQDTFCLQYLMQSGRFFHVFQALLMADDVLPKLYDKTCVFIKEAEREYLFVHFLKAIKKLRFDFRFTLSEKDIDYLLTIDAAEMPAQPKPAAASAAAASSPPPQGAAAECAESPEAGRAEGGGGDTASQPASPGAVSGGASQAGTRCDETADGGDTATRDGSPQSEATGKGGKWDEGKSEEDPPEEGVDVLTLVMQSGEFNKMCEVGKLKIAVRQLITYYTATKKKMKIHKGPKLKQLFDEGKNPTLGVLARERLCPAITALMKNGFRDSAWFKQKNRHIWQYIETVAAAKRKSATDLGSVKLPEAIDTVRNIVDMRVARSTTLNASINDLKLRSLICYALNKSHLKIYLETLYDLSGNPDSVHFHKEWYHQDALMFNADTRSEIDGIIETLDGLNFHLLVDSDVF